MLVFATYHAQKKLKEQHLTPAEFLRPFGEVGDCGGITIITCEKNSNQFFKLNSKFRINFIDNVDVKQPSEEKTNNAVLKNIILEHTPPVPLNFADPDQTKR